MTLQMSDILREHGYDDDQFYILSKHKVDKSVVHNIFLNETWTFDVLKWTLRMKCDDAATFFPEMIIIMGPDSIQRLTQSQGFKDVKDNEQMLYVAIPKTADLKTIVEQ